jgi:hypothetical protein
VYSILRASAAVTSPTGRTQSIDAIESGPGPVSIGSAPGTSSICSSALIELRSSPSRRIPLIALNNADVVVRSYRKFRNKPRAILMQQSMVPHSA